MIENYVVIDLEMTGLNAKADKILEVGAVLVRDAKVTETYQAIVRPGQALSKTITELTGITNEMAENGRDTDMVLREFLAFIGDDIIVGQNVIFDYAFLKQWAVNHKVPLEKQAVDTLKLARIFLPNEEKKNLEHLCAYLGIERRNAHRALDDAIETHLVFEALKKKYGAGREDEFVPKTLQYRAKKQSPATERQKKHLREYASYFEIELPCELDSMTKSEASRLTDQWFFKYGRMPRKSGTLLHTD